MSHKHSEIIDRVGQENVMSHFKMTLRNLQLWRAKGIPRKQQEPFKLLANSLSITELDL